MPVTPRSRDVLGKIAGSDIEVGLRLSFPQRALSHGPWCLCAGVVYTAFKLLHSW